MSQESNNVPAALPPTPEGGPAPVVVAGVVPWLPWPLSAWNWCTVPVRAERLAAWRIGVALCVIVDHLLNYVPDTLDFYGKGGLGDPANFDYRFRSTSLTWSLLRGFTDSTLFFLAFTIWVAATFWIVSNSFSLLLTIHKNPPRNDRTGVSLWIWSAAFLWYVAGLWAQMFAEGKFDALAWIVPLLGCSLSCLFHALDIATRLRDARHQIPWTGLIFTLTVSIALTCGGFELAWAETVDPDEWWTPLFKPWQHSDFLVIALMAAFMASAFLMLIGYQTRYATVLTWMLSMSFGNANPYLENAGDTIRVIMLFYLMLCPCGAAWSVDALFHRRIGPVYVHPWPIRLMFVQMIFIYFLNGIYKLMGVAWLDGYSLHYVLGDLVLTRFSPSMIPIPVVVGQVMTWSVLVWEVAFPVLVLWKWSRRVALFMGVMFHLGIFLTLELGGFVPYALCMYLPLLPWGGSEKETAS